MFINLSEPNVHVLRWTSSRPLLLALTDHWLTFDFPLLTTAFLIKNKWEKTGKSDILLHHNKCFSSVHSVATGSSCRLPSRLGAHVKLSSPDFWLLLLFVCGKVACRCSLSMCGLAVLSLFLTCLEIVCWKVWPSQRCSEHTWAGRPPLRWAVNIREPLNTKMRMDVNSRTQTQSRPLRVTRAREKYLLRLRMEGKKCQCQLPSARRLSSSSWGEHLSCFPYDGGFAVGLADGGRGGGGVPVQRRLSC